MSFVARAFTGHYRLWQIFWLYGLLPAAIVFAVAYFATQAMPELLKPVSVILFLYALWWVISVWRSAFLVNKKLWSYLARLLCAGLLIAMTGAIALILSGGVDDHQTTEAVAPTAPVEAVTRALEAPATEAAPAPAAPVSEAAPAAPIANPIEEECKNKLRAYAQKNNADAELYVSQNQAWVDNCVKKATSAQ